MEGDGRKWGWLERAQLFVLQRSELMFGQPDHKPENGGGAMHISRANDKLKSGNAACRACVPCMEGF